MSRREESQAKYGSDIITTSVHTAGRWWRLYFIGATVFSSLTDGAGSFDCSLSAVTFPEWSYLDGDFTAIRLVSGSLIAYKNTVP